MSTKSPCLKCEVVPPPVNDVIDGDLHCWFPTTHVAGKARALLQQLGVAHVNRDDLGTTIMLPESEAVPVFSGLREQLSSVEREDTRALLTASGVAAGTPDLARVEPLARLLSRAENGWLLALLRERRLASHLQPIVYADRPDVVYAHEALLRGVASDGTLIPPMRLFDAARSTGVMFQLDLAARRSAIAAAVSNSLTSALFINFAPTAIYDPRACLRSTVAAIDDGGIRREDVVFEIVETERAHDVDHLRRILDFYRDAGFRIALDDVGAGYSSLNLIHLLRPDVLKLDMELVRDVDTDPYKGRIVANLLNVANSLDIEPLAEGVETAGELEWLRAHGAKYVQGYLIGKPSPTPWPGPTRSVVPEHMHAAA